LGQTSTDFEVKQRNSARMLSSTAIDHLKNRQRGGLLRTVFVNSGGHETAMVPVQCTPIQHAKKGVRMVTCDPMPHLVRLLVVSVGQFIHLNHRALVMPARTRQASPTCKYRCSEEFILLCFLTYQGCYLQHSTLICQMGSGFSRF